MEIPGFGAGNPLRLNPNTIKAPEALPAKVPPQIDEKTAKKGEAQQSPLLPDQAPAKPVINRTLQSFSNLLSEIGVPNTPQNNQLAQALADYGQPVNKTTINQVANNLGNIMQQGPENIEAALVLVMNKMPVNKKSVDSVKQMLTGGGLAQNFVSLNTDLKKLVDGAKNSEFVKNLETRIKIKQTNLVHTMEQSKEKTDMIQDRSINQLKSMPNSSEQKIEQTGIVKKNPFEEEFTEENNQDTNQNNLENTSNKSLIKQEPKNKTGQEFSLLNDLIENDNILINNQNKTIANNDIKGVVIDLLKRAEKLSTTLNNIVNVDVLKNPANFPQQIAMLKKSYADLEVDVVEMKEILESSFPELKEEIKADDENIFTNLLKMIFDDGKENITKKANLKNLATNLGSESELIKNLSESTKSISENVTGRELLSQNQECMCIPLVLPFNNKIYNVEIMIKREDQSNKKAEVGEVPLKIQLSVETNSMGKVGVDMSNLKKDLQVNLNVNSIGVKNLVNKKINELQERLSNLPFDVKPVTCNINPKSDESNSILLPQKYKVMSMRRIDGVV